jgi:predicted O-linked N-acetylglucosamine transferase (SPINDLY family)
VTTPTAEQLLRFAGQHHAAGDLNAARAACEEARALFPDHPVVLRASGSLAFAAGDLQAALDAFGIAARLPGAPAEAHFEFALALEAAGQSRVAAGEYDVALRIDPIHLGALLNRCAMALERRELELAERLGRALLASHSDRADAWLNLIQACFANVRYAEAADLLKRALARWPDHLGLRCAQVVALAMSGEPEAAWTACRVIRDTPSFEAAVATLPAAAELRTMTPDRLRAVYLTALFERRRVGEWECDALLRTELTRLAADARQDGRLSILPLQAFHGMVLGLSDTDYVSLVERASAAVAAEAPPLPARTNSHADRHLRIGYLSPNFREHPTTYQIRGLLAAHDRSRFEVLAFAVGPTDDGPGRRAIMAAADRFDDLSRLDDRSAAARIREAGVDILVDLGGYFEHARPAIVAARPAALQFSYTEQLGVVAAPFIDYRFADRRVDANLAPGPHEQPVYLPGCFLPYSPPAGPLPRPSRRAVGLPEGSLVYCALHSDYKRSPSSFDAWTAIVRAVPGSVLWLLGGSPRTEAPLLDRAVASGLDARRIHFAARIDNDGHLARLGCADLFLDAFEYGAHTTACEALWAGVPVLTRRGRGLAGRVASSVLHAVDLPELVAGSDADFVAIGTALGRDRERLAALRRRVTALRSHRQFDPRWQVARIEAGFLAAWARHREGKPPGPIELDGDATGACR